MISRLILAGLVALFACTPWFPTPNPAMADDSIGQVGGLPATRVISLAPHLTELVYSIGAGGQLIAVSEYSDYPAAAKALPRVGNASAIDLERIVALQPDLVLVWKSGTPVAHQERLKQLGIPVAIFEFRRLVDIADGIRRMGRLTGHESEAAMKRRAYLDRLQVLRDSYASRKPVTVFYQLWGQPVMTVNGQHMLDDVIQLCGGRNVFAGLEQLVPVVNMESVVAMAPQAIVASAVNNQRPSWLAQWDKWDSIPAVSNNHIFHINADLISRQGPRILKGAEQLCEYLDQVRRN